MNAPANIATMRLTPQEASKARAVAALAAKKRADAGDPVLSVWAQYEAATSLIDEMSGEV